MTTQAELLQHGFTSTVLTNNGQGQFVNSKCAIINDLVFGLCVWDGDRWYPMEQLELEDISHIASYIRAGGHFLWHNKLNKLIEEKQAKVAIKEEIAKPVIEIKQSKEKNMDELIKANEAAAVMISQLKERIETRKEMFKQRELEKATLVDDVNGTQGRALDFMMKEIEIDLIKDKHALSWMLDMNGPYNEAIKNLVK